MRHAGAPILLVATLGFIASSCLYALAPAAPVAPPMTEFGAGPLFSEQEIFLDLSGQFLQPRVLAMSALLVITLGALAFHAIRRVVEARQPGHVTASDRMAENGLLVLGLVAGAVWPWLRDAYPALGVLLCAVMLAGVLGAALSAMHLGGTVRNSGALGFAAGWATLVTCAHFATIMQTQLGAPVSLAAGISILIAALASVNVQLRLGPTISYSVAVIWGMIGLAAGSVAVEAALGMMSVLAIAVIAVALVRVTT